MKAGNRTIDHFEITDVQVRDFGNAAVVTNRATLKGRRNGQDISGEVID